jgi:hypothetical protein
MAPERFFGAPASIGSEVYELAVTLFAMLCGRLPWSDAGDPEARLHPRRPSELGIELPGALEDVLSVALSTRAEGRPPSVRELAARVRAAAAAAGPDGARRTLDLPAAEAQGQVVEALPRSATVSGPAAGLSAGGPAPTEKVPRRSRFSSLVFALAAMGAAGGVGAFVGRLAWKDAGAVAVRAPDASPAHDTPASPSETPDEPDPGPPPGPRQAALTTRVPADVWRHHPKDTVLLVGLSWTQIIDDPGVKAALVAEHVETPAPLANIRRTCGFDPVSELEWVTLGAGAGNKGQDLDMMIAGRWSRDDVERCLTALFPGPIGKLELKRDGRTTWIKIGGRELWLGWVDAHTVFVSFRAGADRPWIEARLDGKDPAEAARELAPLRKGLDEKATFWFAAQPRPLFAAAGMPDVFPWPALARGAFAFGKDVRGEARLGYGSPAEAVQVGDKLAAQLVEARKDMAARVMLDGTTVTVEGKDVVVKFVLEPQANEALVHGAIGVLAQQLGRL